MKLRSYLLLLVIACVLPVVLFAGIMTYRSYQQQRENLEQGMIERARAISAALDREFLVSIQSLKVLGASTRLDKEQLSEFYADMKAALDGYSRAWQNLTLTDSTGQQLINLRRPFGSPLPTSGNPAAIHRVLESRDAVIADLSPGPVTGALGIVVHVPIIKDGRPKYILNAIFYPAPLTELLLQQKLPHGWIATILDRSQKIAARTQNIEKFIGKPAGSSFAAQAKQSKESSWRGTTLDGSAVVAALHRSDLTGWTIGLASPATEIDAPLRKSMILIGAGGLGLLFLALGLAAKLGQRIAEPVSALAGDAEKLGRGETPHALRSPIIEVTRVAQAMKDAGTKRNEAEAALRKSEANLAAAQARAKLGSWELDLATQTGSWSAEMFRLFEWDAATGAPTFTEYLELIHPEDRGLIEETHALALRLDEECVVEFRSNPLRGPERYFTAISRATKDLQGQVVQLAGTVQDVTSQKQDEARIQQLNRVYAVLSDINQAIVRLREPQTLLSEACRIAIEKGEFRLAWIGRLNKETGKIEAIAQAGFSDGYVEQLMIFLGDKQHDAGPTGSALREGRYEVCNDIERDPRMAPWRQEALRRGFRSCAAFPLKVGNEVVGAFNLYSSERGFFDAEELPLLDELAADIGLALEIHRNESERLRAESALRQSEERFRQLAENIREVFWLSTPDKSRMIYVSPGYELIWGRSCQSLYDSPRDWVDAIHPDDREQVLQAALREQATGIYDKEYRIMHPDGAIRWIRDRAFPVRDARGEIYRIAGIAEDVTEREEAQEALRRSHEQLEEKVAQRTRELLDANVKLKDLDRLKSQFLANMSHELRTPLNAIIGFSQLMHDGKVGPISPAQKEYLGDILTSSTHLLQLINDVLDLSKVEAGRMEVLKSTFPIDEIIVEVVHNIAPIMSTKELRLIREIPQDLEPITTDKRKLLQILLNLASNAVKFTERGEIRIRCEIVSPTLLVSVSDTGIGIRPEDLPLLFQPFSQVDDSLRKRHIGTGLGLYLSRRLAHLLGGEITVESEYGKGSTFRLEIPINPESSLSC
jgi:PAS domain S-box-containing protein